MLPSFEILWLTLVEVRVCDDFDWIRVWGFD